jgi:hypothetical protein
MDGGQTCQTSIDDLATYDDIQSFGALFNVVGSKHRVVSTCKCSTHQQENLLLEFVDKLSAQLRWRKECPAMQ